MNEVQKYVSEKFGDLRVTLKTGEPWFVAADVCKALDIAQPTRACERLDEDEKGVSLIHTPGGEQELLIINEPGLYSMVLGSRKKEAKAFKRWVTHDVIPSIRKHGVYMTTETMEKVMNDPDFLINLLQELKAERARRISLESENAVMLPKAEYCDAVLRSESLIATNVIAKDYGMHATRFNRMLENMGVQYKRGGIWTLKVPYDGQGYAQSATFQREGSDNTYLWLKWTEKGRKFLYDFLKEHEILPVSERQSKKQHPNTIF